MANTTTTELDLLKALTTSGGATDSLNVVGTLSTGQGYSNTGQSTPKQVVVTTSTTVLLSANTNRKYAHFINNSVSPVYLQYSSSAVPGQGIKLNIGSIWQINSSELWLGAVNAISASGSLNIDVFEGII